MWKNLVFPSAKETCLCLAFWNHKISSYNSVSIYSFFNICSSFRRKGLCPCANFLWIPPILTRRFRLWLKIFPNVFFLFHSCTWILNCSSWAPSVLSTRMFVVWFLLSSLWPSRLFVDDLWWWVYLDNLPFNQRKVSFLLRIVNRRFHPSDY